LILKIGSRKIRSFYETKVWKLSIRVDWSLMIRKIKIESAVSNLRVVENAIDEVVNELGIKQENYGKILVSTLEAVNNAIMHGNKYDMEKMVDVEISFKKEKLKIRIKDEGLGFTPGDVPDPTTPENIEALNGRGIFLMSKLADEIKYSKKGNEVTMYFNNIKD
jgi:serine/threonine-protein kinase RsbW